MAATAQETLADEQRLRPRAAVAALAAAALTLLGAVVGALVLSGKPSVPLIGALRDALGLNGGAVSLKTREALFFHDRAIGVVGISLLNALAVLAAGFALVSLFRFTKARRPETSTTAVALAVAGSMLVAVAMLVASVARAITTSDFASSSDHGVEAARKALEPGAFVAASSIQFVGFFVLGLGFVFGALNAMRVGLLTRFLGVLGIIVGGLFVLQLGALSLVEIFWLGALGVLFLGRWPGGMPPAWVTGEAQPWPTQQELRELREARREEPDAEPREEPEAEPARAGGRGRPAQPKTPAPEVRQRAANPAAKKRKRRRR